MNIIHQITPFRKYKRLFSIGDKYSKKCVYKYMSFSSFQKCLENNTFMFRQPSSWTDPFESRFYQGNYTQLGNNADFDRKLFACCVTKNKSSEAAWKIYSNDPQNDPCVEICISIGQLRKFLNDYAIKNNLFIYEGSVNYGLNDNVLDTIHLKSNKHHSCFFHHFDIEHYLNLLLLKRKAFEYEGELRYFLRGDNVDFTKNSFMMEIPWSLCINSITLSPFHTREINDELDNILEQNVELCKAAYPLYYPHKPFVYESNLYRLFNQITIEPCD